MPIKKRKKELTHDCVRLLGAQMSYQYARLKFPELNLMLPCATFKFHSWDFCALDFFFADFKISVLLCNCPRVVLGFVHRCLILMEATSSHLSNFFFFFHLSLPLFLLYFLWSFCWEIYLWTNMLNPKIFVCHSAVRRNSSWRRSCKYPCVLLLLHITYNIH